MSKTRFRKKISIGLIYFSVFLGLTSYPAKSNILFNTSGPEKYRQQTFLVKGTVLDKITQAPVPYATISVTDSKIALQTDLTGTFVLTLKPGNSGSRIRISSLGYALLEISVADILIKPTAAAGLKFYLEPDYKNLKEVNVNAKAKNWKVKRVGYHLDEGAPFYYEANPSDTISGKASGQEIGTRIRLGKYPAFLRSISFGLAGLSETEIRIQVHIYSLKNNLPHVKLLLKPAIITIPLHTAGWITVNMQDYNIKLKEDFAIVVEWLENTGEQNRLSLMDFASLPKGQLIYIRSSQNKPWKVIKSSLIDINSIGMYAMVVYEK